MGQITAWLKEEIVPLRRDRAASETDGWRHEGDVSRHQKMKNGGT